MTDLELGAGFILVSSFIYVYDTNRWYSVLNWVENLATRLKYLFILFYFKLSICNSSKIIPSPRSMVCV